VAAPELPSQGDGARSHGTRGSAGGHLSKEVKSEVEGHVAAPDLTLARRRGLRPWDTWKHQNYNIRGSAWMHVTLFVLT
jgi:hypothetical protein